MKRKLRKAWACFREIAGVAFIVLAASCFFGSEEAKAQCIHEITEAWLRVEQEVAHQKRRG